MNRRGLLLNLGLVALTAGVTYAAGRRARFAGGYYVQFGTSLTSGGTGTKYGHLTPSIVSDRLGMASLNVGFPGSCAGLHKIPDLNPFSLCNLVDAVVSGDWSSQSDRSGETTRDTSLSRLETTNFPSVTHIGLEYGTNDFHYDRPIGCGSDRGKETFKGAINYSIQKLLGAFPQVRLFLITPSWMKTEDSRDSDRYPNGRRAFLKDYVDAMVRVAELNHIPCLDLWRTSGINKVNQTTFLVDGTHPTDAGVLRRAEAIASFMNAVF